MTGHATVQLDIPVIQSTRLFTGFSAFEIRLLFGECGHTRGCDDGEVIIEAGSQGRDIYLLPAGSVKTEIPLPPYAPATLATLGAPTTFGEISYLDGRERSATVRAHGRLTLHVLSGERLDALFLDLPHTRAKLHHNIALSLADIVRTYTRNFHDGVMKLRTAQNQSSNQAASKYYDMISRLAGNIC
ncbi:cyclic nucleotide-binding domain-containing protein [Endothiovibrio diazotrophicus]